MAIERVFRKIISRPCVVSSGLKSRKCISANNTWYHVQHGYGVTQDFAQAHTWYNLGGASGEKVERSFVIC